MPALRLSSAACTVLVIATIARGADGGCLTMHDLQHMPPCQLEALFRQAVVGTPLVGSGAAGSFTRPTNAIRG